MLSPDHTLTSRVAQGCQPLRATYRSRRSTWRKYLNNAPARGCPGFPFRFLHSPPLFDDFRPFTHSLAIQLLIAFTSSPLPPHPHVQPRPFVLCTTNAFSFPRRLRFVPFALFSSLPLYHTYTLYFYSKDIHTFQSQFSKSDCPVYIT